MRANLNEAGGRNRTATLSEHQAHHLIPKDLIDHEAIQNLKMDMDHWTNGKMLKEVRANGNPGHKGSHAIYNEALEAKLDAIAKLPKSKWEHDIVNLQNRLDTIFSRSNYPPLYKEQGGTVKRWKKILGL